MGNSKLIFKISPQGVLTIEGQDFQGKNCLKAAEAYMQALGTVENQSLKPEFFNGGETQITVNN